MKRVLFVLGQLSDTDIEWMIDNGTKQQYLAGEHLVKQGEVIDHIYIVLSGEFKIYNEERAALDIAKIGSGELVGEMSFLDERPPSVSVQATRDSNVYAISLDVVKRRMEVDTRFAASFYYSIALFLSNRLRSTTSKLGYGIPEDEVDELNMNVLNEVGKAGARFSRILNKFSEIN